MRLMSDNFSLVIPTYNEKDNINLLLEKLVETLGPGDDFEIVVVDDDSPDLTWKIAESRAQKDKRIKIIRRRNERGLSSAVIEGFNKARGEILGVMDADLSHDHFILPQMIKAVRDEDYDLAVGSRRIPGGGSEKWPRHRKISSDIATILAKRVLGVKLSDPMSGFFTLKRDLFESIKQKLNPRGYKILLEIYVRSHPRRIKEIPFVFKDRRQGYSKVTLKVMVEYFQMLYRLRSK